MNVVSSVMQSLTPDVVTRIGSTLGIEAARTQSAIGAAVPGLLASLSHVAIQPGGAQRLADYANEHEHDFGDFAGMLGNGGRPALIQRGSEMYSTLLGSHDAPVLSNAIGSYAGVSRGKSESLLGVLTPVVMGTIAREQHGHTDARGIAGFFAMQKDSIVSSLPSGFTRMLGSTGLLDAVGGAKRTAAAATARTTQAAGATTRTAARTASTTAQRGASWVWWAIGLIGALALMFFWMSSQRPVPTVSRSVPPLMISGVNVGTQLNDSIGGLRSSLENVIDADSARRALPRLRTIDSQIDQVVGLGGQMSVAQQNGVAGIIKPVLPGLRGLADSVLARPGVADVLGPTLDPIMSKLSSLTL